MNVRGELINWALPRYCDPDCIAIIQGNGLWKRKTLYFFWIYLLKITSSSIFFWGLLLVLLQICGFTTFSLIQTPIFSVLQWIVIQTWPQSMQSSQIKWKLEVELFNIKLAALFPLFLHRRSAPKTSLCTVTEMIICTKISVKVQSSAALTLTSPTLS